MSVDWAKEGLLEGLEEESARAERAALLDELHEDGVPLEDLRCAVEEGRLAFLPVERALGGDEQRLTAAEVAEQAGIEEDLVGRVRRALGLPAPGTEERVFQPGDVEAFAILGSFTRAGFSEEDQLDVTRVIGRAMSQIADTAGGLAARTVAQPGDSERDFANRMATAAEHLLPMLGTVVEAALGAHLRQVAQQAVVDASDLASGVLPGSRHAAVAFADLVGFTKLGEDIPGHDLGPIVGRLEQLADEAAEPPVKVVKMIGDAAMLVGPGAECVVDAALRLVQAGEDSEDFPSIRAGVSAGEALARAGDWYGRPVNLASRVTSLARPGTVLVTEEVKQELGEEGWHWSFAGKKKLKGIRGERALHRARRQPPDDGES